MKTKKHYTSEEKTKILREHLENHLPISDLAEKYNLHPNAIYLWKKQMYEQAPESLSKSKKSSEKQLGKAEKRIKELEELLSMRETLIAELVADNIELKKNDGVSYVRNGSNRRYGTK